MAPYNCHSYIDIFMFKLIEFYLKLSFIWHTIPTSSIQLLCDFVAITTNTVGSMIKEKTL